MPSLNAARGRVEDERLLRGRGRFVDDLRGDGEAHACAARSPLAHATIRSLDVAAAAAMPGVATVLTAGDADVAALGPLPSTTPVTGRDGHAMVEPPRPVLASREVKFVGEAIALVVADTPAQAQQAAEAVAVEFDELPAVAEPLAALAAGAPRVWAQAAENVSFEWVAGDAEAVEAALARADHVVAVRVVHPRLAVAALEPRALLAQHDAASATYTLHVPTQGVHAVRDVLADAVLRIPRERLRVVTPDVGGSFGMKIVPYPEYALALVAARRIARPVKWTASRTESFLTDTQGRARVDDVTLALDRNGRMLALKIDAVADLGAYLSTVGPYVPTAGAVRVLGHSYRIGAVAYRVRGVFTNAAPVDAYRGAGKPECVASLERVIDVAARRLRLDRIKLRRRNLVRPADLPYATPLGETYDSGDYPALLERVLALADWDGFASRAEAAHARARLRGIGVGMYVHATGGSTAEVSEVRAEQDGSVTVLSGTQASGQGHETVLAQIAAECLEIPHERIRVVQGDTNRVAAGGGTGGSSLLAIAGNTLTRAAAAMVERGRGIAAARLEVAALDVEYGAGEFRVAGTDRVLSLAQVAAVPEAAGEGGSGCVGRAAFEGRHTTYPSGAYVAEVEVDPETGAVVLAAFSGVDDLGRILHRALALGQLHGGLAQGVGEAMMESVSYDPDGAQLLTATFLDYWLPRAADLPCFALEQRATPSTANALGVKGAGEVSAIGAPGAVINAVVHALECYGVDELDMPATPRRVWEAISRRKT